MDILALYLEFAKLRFLAQTEYRLDYFIRMISKIVSWSTGFIMISILLYKFKSIGEWNTYEVMFLYALDVFSYSIAATFLMGPCKNLSKNIQSGNFDEILIRPVNSLLYYVCKLVSAGYTSNYILSVLIIAICFKQLNIALTLANLAMLILVLSGASLIQGAAFLITSIPAFWFIKSTGISHLFYMGMTRFLRYPISIYGKVIQLFLTVILPYAFINFFPAQYFLNKNDFLMFNSFFQYLTPLVGVVLFIIAYLFWNIGINHYKSTGS